MAARRYEISLRVDIFQHEKRNFVFKSDHVMFCLLYQYQLYNTNIVSTLRMAPLRKARIIVLP